MPLASLQASTPVASTRRTQRDESRSGAVGRERSQTQIRAAVEAISAVLAQVDAAPADDGKRVHVDGVAIEDDDILAGLDNLSAADVKAAVAEAVAARLMGVFGNRRLAS